MTTRNDLTVEFSTSPRIAEVAAPSNEISMQDLVDTLRKEEDAFYGMTFNKLLNASGKEDLGGGVKVGITVALQNLLLSFEGRTTPAQVGVVTATPLSPVASRRIMQDSSATFITNGVQRGSLVIDFTDQSVADVISVDSETQLTTKILSSGTTNEYSVSDDYKVWNIEQVVAAGGNLTAVDETQTVIASILPTAFTQVVLTSSSSATLQEQTDIQFASFNGAVTVDLQNETGNAVAGTTFPAGTERTPSNNFIDAIDIADDRGFLSFRIIGDASITSGLDFTDYAFYGRGQNLSLITLGSDGLFVNATFVDATITGVLDGDAHVENCIVQNLTFVSGVIENCILDTGTLTLGGNQAAHFINCASGVPGSGTPTIDLGGSGQPLALRNYNGGIELVNKTGSESVSIDLNSGQVIIADTVTTGDIILRGVGKWVNRDTYAGGATIIDELLTTEDLKFTRAIMEADHVFDKGAGLLHYYYRGTTTDIIPAKSVAGEQVTTSVSLVE